MLTFSTYPLFLANQSWSPPYFGERHRVQFASDNAEGIYNAALALLGETDQLLDYSSPFKQRTVTPPMWVSIVGNDSFWPVAMIDDLHKFRQKEDPRIRESKSDEPSVCRIRYVRLCYGDPSVSAKPLALLGETDQLLDYSSPFKQRTVSCIVYSFGIVAGELNAMALAEVGKQKSRKNQAARRS